MSVRNTEIIGDGKKVLIALITAKIATGTPWNRWKVIDGFPNAKIFEHFDKAILFVTDPQLKFEGSVGQYGGDLGRFPFTINVGIWANDDHGGESEVERIYSRFFDFATNIQSANAFHFTVKLADTTYTDTDLYTMKMPLESPGILVRIPTLKVTEHRGQFDLNFTYKR
jgi:hypothetical protein